MIRSMTGFGVSSVNFENKIITVEIRSVNSKFLDLNLRMPQAYREKELEIRAETGRFIERGKSEVIITVDSPEMRKPSFNRELLRLYYNELKSINTELGTTTNDYLRILLALPEVLQAEKHSLSDEEWNSLLKCIEQSKKAFDSFRTAEGKAIEKDLRARISAIETGLKSIEEFEPGRIDIVRKRLEVSLEEFIQANNIDRNRFEQELIFYIEKFDISEEKVRLRSHCEYFIKTMEEENSSGKKLSFIAQEIGREINTIGSKANDATMQKAVVIIKDELEKIKEQILNVL
jgi:uncharacterized protein (TIGR00255 family)